MKSQGERELGGENVGAGWKGDGTNSGHSKSGPQVCDTETLRRAELRSPK